MNGNLGGKTVILSPEAVRGAAISVLLCTIGALSIAPFWRSSPVRLGALAAAPYLFIAALFLREGRAYGLIFWCGASLGVYLLFGGLARLYRLSR
jgi:hypothetical protein